MKKFGLALIVASLFSLGAAAQSDNGGIKQDTKDAAHSTGQAAKKTGKKTKTGTKKTVHKAAQGVRNGAGKVEDKPKPPQ